MNEWWVNGATFAVRLIPTALRCGLHLSPLAGRGRREAPGEGASSHALSLLKRPLTRFLAALEIDLSPQAGRGKAARLCRLAVTLPLCCLAARRWRRARAAALLRARSQRLARAEAQPRPPLAAVCRS